MLFVAIPLFLIAAMFGLTMAIFIFKNRFPPFFLIGAHGFFALGALVLAIWAAGTAGTPSVVVLGVVVILVGALGGVFLISFQFRDETQPKIVVVLHGLAAVSGVSCLLLGLFEIARYSRPQWLTLVGH